MEGKGKGGGEGKERLRDLVMGLLGEEVVRREEVSKEKEEKGKGSKKIGGKKKKIKRGKEGGEGARRGARAGKRVSFGVAQDESYSRDTISISSARDHPEGQFKVPFPFP